MKARLVICAFLLAGGAAVYAAKQHDDRMWRDYRSARPGMSASQAEAVLGTPSWRGKCRAKIRYGGSKDCQSELGYRSWFAPLNPVYWVVELDSQNRVISADWIASP